MATPFLFYDELIASSVEGGYVEKPKLSQSSSVFLLSVCYMSRMRWLWQNPIDPIDDIEWGNILDLITLAENELMMSFGIGTIIPSAVDLDAELSLLRMNGQTVSQDDYPILFDIVPNGWISGTDIIIPNMDDVSLHGGYSNVGGIVGANSEQLTTAQIPSHTHTQVAHTHTTIIPLVTPVGAVPVPPTPNVVIGTPAPTGLTTAVNLNTGGDGSHNNIPESLEVIYYLVAR